ncbi:SDR family NAD(P)-dependent oxidoreductase [Robiginitalea sp. M366]|uniref:SDR family NAD(P)-dependent oxidoreductase n=1 Tax=Robiginitalea aestuariiviva TaxID=3036903 RepID=UPI00240E4AC0|nr:SDR family oxidoreductase [Robiginitalea aestuariiviva]MDG1572056.1 SDR family NAD(P)-dependent oxidoreductase [Robiginitalea aestuariiviva]
MASVVVTGTSRGIGLELVKTLAAQGHRVLALSRNPGPCRDLGLEAVHAMPFDLDSDTAFNEAARWVETSWGKADVLIHNAGSLVLKPFVETTPEDFLQVYQVNVFGVARLTQALLPLLHPKGHVVAISSMGGIQGSAKFPGLAAYSSSKGAVITLMELLAEEFKETGPSFNTLALGAVQTEMLEAAFPGYQAPVTAAEMAEYIARFALTGHRYYNGKVLQVSNSTP